MAKKEKIHDKDDNTLPLRVKQRKVTKRLGANFRVRCGCCKETLVVLPPPSNASDTNFEIGGVMGTKSQWQQFFGRLLDMELKEAK